MSISEIPFTKVSRTRVIAGRSTPAFIHNYQYYFVALDIYEDGIIYCWQTTDLASFRKKLEQGWVVASIPDGQSISIHGLGSWKIADGNWLFDEESFYQYVTEMVREMNPEGRNLHQIFEKRVGKVTYSENAKGKVYRENPLFEGEPFPAKENGDSFHLFYKNEDEYFLVRLSVFADGKIEISGLPQTLKLDLKKAQELVAKGLLLTAIPPKAKVNILALGTFTAEKVNSAVAFIEDKMLEIGDIIETLNGRRNSIEICRDLYDEYVKKPTPELKDKLKTAYENIPRHQRIYVGDMDTRDTDVREAIYGE